MTGKKKNMHCVCNAYLLHYQGGDKMAEFCLDCWNRIHEIADTKHRYVLTLGKDLCEGCGQYKRVVVGERLLWRILKIRRRRNKMGNKVGNKSGNSP